jgi:hypothetical protein
MTPFLQILTNLVFTILLLSHLILFNLCTQNCALFYFILFYFNSKIVGTAELCVTEDLEQLKLKNQSDGW